MTDTNAGAGKSVPICSLIAAATLALCMFTPRLIVTLPIMAAVGLAIAAAFRRERPIFGPYIIGALAVFLLLQSEFASSNDIAPMPSASAPALATNLELYGNAKWEYGSKTDEMRGTTKKWAALDSATELNLEAPYSGQNHARIMLSKNGAGAMVLIVDQGQITCRDATTIPIKFDNLPALDYSCQLPENGKSNIVIIEPYILGIHTKNVFGLDKWIAKSKTMIVEIEFYDSGVRQIKFNISGLDQDKY